MLSALFLRVHHTLHVQATKALMYRLGAVLPTGRILTSTFRAFGMSCMQVYIHQHNKLYISRC